MTKSHLIIVLFTCLPLTATAYEYSSSRPPLPLTVQETQSFEDAPKLFPIKKLPDVGIKFRGFSWFNDNTAITGLDHFGQWTAEHTELPKVSLLNLDTGAITETPYRGSLVCYRADLVLVCPNNRYGCSAKGISLLSGKYGEELKPSNISVFSGLDKNTCESTSLIDSNSIDVSNPKIPKNYRFRVLGKDSGYIGWSEVATPSKEPSFLGRSFGFFNNNFEPYWQGYQGSCDYMFTIFHPWDGSYLMGHDFNKGAWECSQYRTFLIYPNKEKVQEISLPALFEGWLRGHIVGINLAMTKNGLLVYAKPGSDLNRIGLFWVNAQGQIKRLIANRLIEFLSVAPDGCHVLIQHHETNLVMVGMPATEDQRKKILRTFETSVIDMCGAKQ